jgi:hypothetical protein
MKNLIKKILKEEFDDFDWAKEETPFKPGKEFEESDICVDDDSCEININEDEIIYNLTWDRFSEIVGLGDDAEYYIKPVMWADFTYEGEGDSYEFEDDEFNYAGYRVNDDQKLRFENILKTIGVEDSFETFIDQDNFNGIEDKLKFIPLKSYFDDMRSEYLHNLGYALQKNRWISLSVELKDVANKSGCEWYMPSYNKLVITVPMKLYINIYGSEVKDLTELLQEISSGFGGYWSDAFYDGWDTDGYDEEINGSFNLFLDKAEDFLDDPQQVEEYQNIYDLLNSMGFSRSRWGNYYTYIKQNDNDTSWVLALKYDDTKEIWMSDLSLRRGANIWGDKIREFLIPLEDTPKYIYNYSLKLESTKK